MADALLTNALKPANVASHTSTVARDRRGAGGVGRDRRSPPNIAPSTKLTGTDRLTQPASAHSTGFTGLATSKE